MSTLPAKVYKLQITDLEDRVVEIPAGGKLEQDFIATVTEAVVAEGVGLFRTEAQVKASIAKGITQVIKDLKFRTRSGS